MKTFNIRRSVIVLFAGVVGLLAPVTQAGMVTTQQVVTDQQAQTDRDKVRAFLDRAGVQERLQTLGVEAGLARVRVDALSDQEVSALAQRIDQLPAGGALSHQDLIIILLIAILIIVAV